MKNHDLTQDKCRFQEIMDWYRGAYGVKKFDPPALEMGFDELQCIKLDRLDDIIRDISRTEDEAMNMTKLIKAIKLKQRPIARTEPVKMTDEDHETPEDKEIIRKNMARFKRFQEIAVERGHDWWSDILAKGLEFSNVGNIWASLRKNGPGCYMNWVMIIPYLKNQDFWPELEAAANAPVNHAIKASELTNLRRFPTTQRLGNAAAYRVQE